MSSDGPLHIDFCGETTTLSPGTELSFGRAADISVDDNPYMHRLVGQFEHRAGRWWVRNLGSSIVLDVYSSDTRAGAQVAPGTDAALVGGATVISFTAHLSNYELIVNCELSDTDLTSPSRDVDAGATVNRVDMPMTDTQLALVLALAEPSLLDPANSRKIPPSKQAASRLGWSMTTFNRKLDNVCDKLAKAGVRGVKASGGEPAHNRRECLVEYAISSGLVDETMLPLLDG